MTFTELKLEAKDKLAGNYGSAILIILITLVIAAIISLIVNSSTGLFEIIKLLATNNMTLEELITYLASSDTALVPWYISLIEFIYNIAIVPVFTVGTSLFYLNVLRVNHPTVGNLFSEFPNFLRITGLALLMGLFTFLWSLLLIIPGIIKAYAYSQAFYIMADDPNCTIREALNRSQLYMQGNKFRYFLLNLSFIGWQLLSCLTLFLLNLWLTPYVNATNANFYTDIKEKYEQLHRPAPSSEEPVSNIA